MKALQELRYILKSIAQDVEVLPAVGGAVEDLKRPDFEEREDQALNEDEKVFETVFEHDPSGAQPPLYRPVPPLGRTQDHLFRYFLDGSFRSYFLGTILENERESPVHFAQVGACVLRREDDGSVRLTAKTPPPPATPTASASQSATGSSTPTLWRIRTTNWTCSSPTSLTRGTQWAR